MITEEIIKNHFVDVQRITENILRFKDILPDLQYIYYLGQTKSESRNILVISQNIEDDLFAAELIQAAFYQNDNNLSLLKFGLDIENKYKFDFALLADSRYHSCFKGRLDDVRETLYLCLPIFECEFSGRENVAVFYEMRRFLIASLDWNRPITPRVLLRFDNPKTKGGTKGTEYFPVKYNVLKAEIANLSGISNGFIEVINYYDEYARINSPFEDQYIMEVQGKSICNGSYKEIEAMTWNFLTQKMKLNETQ